jgi:hypothetical protein
LVLKGLVGVVLIGLKRFCDCTNRTLSSYQYQAYIHSVKFLASEIALSPRSLDMLSLTTFFKEPRSDVNKPVNSPTCHQKIRPEDYFPVY